MNSILRKITVQASLIQGLAELCFPPYCLYCKAPLPQSVLLFCPDCLHEIKFLEEPLCPCCGIMYQTGENHLCSVCLRKKWNFTRARAAVIYNDTVAKALFSLKYGGRRAALKTFQKMMEHSSVCSPLADADYIIPVPLHVNRLRHRGFNQALLLANAFFPDRKHAIKKDTLVRIKDTIPQTGLNGVHRRKNMRNAFAVRNSQSLMGKNVLLVDDVFTTGTTVDECAGVLLDAGAGQVDVLTFARVRE